MAIVPIKPGRVTKAGAAAVEAAEARLADCERRRAELKERLQQVRDTAARIDGRDIDSAVNALVRGVQQRGVVEELLSRLDAEERETRQALAIARQGEAAAAVPGTERALNDALAREQGLFEQFAAAVLGTDRLLGEARAAGTNDPVAQVPRHRLARQYLRADQALATHLVGPERVHLALQPTAAARRLSEERTALERAEARKEAVLRQQAERRARLAAERPPAPGAPPQKPIIELDITPLLTDCDEMIGLCRARIAAAEAAIRAEQEGTAARRG